MSDSFRLQVDEYAWENLSSTTDEYEASYKIYEEQEEVKEMKYKAWVEYSFVIGAWIFTVSMYLIYFLIINTEVSFSHLVTH